MLFDLYAECLFKEALEGKGDFKIGIRITETVKYVDDQLLLAKAEETLQVMTDRLVERGNNNERKSV